MTLIDFLSCSKLLLQKARVALIDGQRLSTDSANTNASTSGANPAPGNATNRGSLGGSNANLLSSGVTNRASLGSSVQSSGSVNTLGSEVETSREQQQFITWQTEMEKSFDVLVGSILPYMTDLSDSDLLLSLK